MRLLRSTSFCSYVVWKRKGYQQFQEPRGSNVIKVKGIGRVSVSNPSFYPSRSKRDRARTIVFSITLADNTIPALWDASEFGIPPIVCRYCRSVLFVIIDLYSGRECLFHCHSQDDYLRTDTGSLSERKLNRHLSRT